MRQSLLPLAATLLILGGCGQKTDPGDATTAPASAGATPGTGNTAAAARTDAQSGDMAKAASAESTLPGKDSSVIPPSGDSPATAPNESAVKEAASSR